MADYEESKKLIFKDIRAKEYGFGFILDDIHLHGTQSFETIENFREFLKKDVDIAAYNDFLSNLVNRMADKIASSSVELTHPIYYVSSSEVIYELGGFDVFNQILESRNNKLLLQFELLPDALPNYNQEIQGVINLDLEIARLACENYQH